jgi:hypothetical protein
LVFIIELLEFLFLREVSHLISSFDYSNYKSKRFSMGYDKYKSFLYFRHLSPLFFELFVDQGASCSHCPEDGDDSTENRENFENGLSCIFAEFDLGNQNDPKDDCELYDSSCAHFLNSAIESLDLNDVFDHSD